MKIEDVCLKCSSNLLCSITKISRRMELAECPNCCVRVLRFSGGLFLPVPVTCPRFELWRYQGSFCRQLSAREWRELKIHQRAYAMSGDTPSYGMVLDAARKRFCVCCAEEEAVKIYDTLVEISRKKVAYENRV